MIKFVVIVERLAQLEVLLGVAKGLDLTPDLGIDPGRSLPSRRKARSTKARKSRRKPKRYPPSMSVVIGPEPTTGAPKLREAYAKLKSQFGTAAFRKADGRKTLNGSSTYVTKLLDTGGLIPA